MAEAASTRKILLARLAVLLVVVFLAIGVVWHGFVGAHEERAARNEGHAGAFPILRSGRFSLRLRRRSFPELNRAGFGSEPTFYVPESRLSGYAILAKLA